MIGKQKHINNIHMHQYISEYLHSKFLELVNSRKSKKNTTRKIHHAEFHRKSQKYTRNKNRTK